MAQIARAILLASAMATNIRGFLAIICVSQETLRIDRRASQASPDIAPMIRSRRMSAWPAFDTRPNRSLPPEERWRGTSPSHAAKPRPHWKLAIWGANASTASAVRGPMPGIVCNRLDMSVCAAKSFAFFVFASILTVFSAICSTRSRHSSRASAGRSQFGSSRMASICLSYPAPGSWCKREPLPATPFMAGSGGGWIAICWVVMDRSRV